MSNQGIIYRCPYSCPIHKRCFVVKLAEEPMQPLTVLQKCEARKKDVEIMIGKSKLNAGERKR